MFYYKRDRVPDVGVVYTEKHDFLDFLTLELQQVSLYSPTYIFEYVFCCCSITELGKQTILKGK